MNVDHLALLGIGVFCFMALVCLANMIRSWKHSKPRLRPRVARRLLGGEELARSVAVSVVNEVAGKNPESVSESRRLGRLTPELEKELDKAQTYYLNRVESRYRVLFSIVVKETILEDKSDTA